MNHTHMQHHKTRRRWHRRILPGLVLVVAVATPFGTAASGDKGDRKPIHPHVAFSDIDNEGPVTRQQAERRVVVERARRDAILHWRGPIRLDLILPIRTMPRHHLPRR